MANFNQKPEKFEKPPFSNQITSKTPTPSVSEPTDDMARVYASRHTQNDVILQPQSTPATYSNASSSELPAAIGHQKSTLASAVFESQPPTVSAAPTSIVTALKMGSELFDFVKNYQKNRKVTNSHSKSHGTNHFRQFQVYRWCRHPTSTLHHHTSSRNAISDRRICKKSSKRPIFTQKRLPAFISGNLKLKDDDNLQNPLSLSQPLKRTQWRPVSSKTLNNHPFKFWTISNGQMKQNHSQHHLQSLLNAPVTYPAFVLQQKNPFSSLCRRHRHHSRNLQQFFNPWSQFCCHSRYHSSIPYMPYNISQPPSVSLDWDQDPCLADLSTALRALGWIPSVMFSFLLLSLDFSFILSSIISWYPFLSPLFCSHFHGSLVLWQRGRCLVRGGHME